MIGGEEGKSKGETNLASSLNVLHSPEYPERFTELSGEEKGGGGGDGGDLGEKRESQKEREQSSL